MIFLNQRNNVKSNTKVKLLILFCKLIVSINLWYQFSNFSQPIDLARLRTYIPILLVTPQQSSFFVIDSKMTTNNFEVLFCYLHGLFQNMPLTISYIMIFYSPFYSCSCFTNIIFSARFFKKFNVIYDVMAMLEPSFIFRFKTSTSPFPNVSSLALMFSGKILFMYFSLSSN